MDLYIDIDKETELNEKERMIIYTGKMQIIIQCLKPIYGLIPPETHIGVEQFVKCVSGEGIVVFNNVQYRLSSGLSVLIPANTAHSIVNIRSQSFKFYTIYSSKVH